MIPFDIVIDVSDNNPRIDWRQAYAAGIRVALCKILENPAHPYPTGPLQLAGAAAAGIIGVPYGFLRPVNPITYAREFKTRCDLRPGMRFMLDWEGRASQTCTPAIAEMIGEELAQTAGVKPIGYWGEPGATPALPTRLMQSWDRMVPRYPHQGARCWTDLPEGVRNRPEAKWIAETRGLPRLAQYTAWGRVPGIAGDVDRSVVFALTEAAALAWFRPPPKPPQIAQHAGERPPAATQAAETGQTAPAVAAGPPASKG
jgi:hypothetical protein